MSIKITKNYFAGGDLDKLSDVIRKLAQAQARRELTLVSTEFTDSSGGTPSYKLVALDAALPAFTETGTASSPKAGFDTAIGKVAAAQAVMARHLNRVGGRLGLPSLIDNTGGAVATPSTIPALDVALTAVSSLCVERVSANNRLKAIKDNMAVLAKAANRLAIAVGGGKIVDEIGGDVGLGLTLKAIPATASSVAGTLGSTLSDTAVDAQLLKIAANVATLAKFVNDVTGSALTDLTNSAGGTASNVLAAQAAPAAFTTAATDCAPKAGFDSEVAKWENNFADFAARANILASRKGMERRLVDQTGATANTTIEAVLAALTAVTGTTVCVDRTSALVTLAALRNNFATVADFVNDLLDYVPGVVPLTDSTGGVASYDDLIVNIPTTSGGNDGTALATISDVDMDALLVIVRNAFTSVGDKLNEITGTETEDTALAVVAFDD